MHPIDRLGVGDITFALSVSQSVWAQKLNPFPTAKNLYLSKFKAFADDKIDVIDICFGKGRKQCGKWRKCRLPAFSPFPTMFSKACFTTALKTRDCLGKG